MAHRMNEIDARLFKCALEENLRDNNDEKDSKQDKLKKALIRRKSTNLSPIEIEKELKKNTVLPYGNGGDQTSNAADEKSRNMSKSNIGTKDLTHIENVDIYSMHLGDLKSINTLGLNTIQDNSKL